MEVFLCSAFQGCREKQVAAVASHSHAALLHPSFSAPGETETVRDAGGSRRRRHQSAEAAMDREVWHQGVRNKRRRQAAVEHGHHPNVRNKTDTKRRRYRCEMHVQGISKRGTYNKPYMGGGIAKDCLVSECSRRQGRNDGSMWMTREGRDTEGGRRCVSLHGGGKVPQQGVGAREEIQIPNTGTEQGRVYGRLENKANFKRGGKNRL